MKVNKRFVENALLDEGKMSIDFNIEYGCPGALLGKVAVQTFVELDSV